MVLQAKRREGCSGRGTRRDRSSVAGWGHGMAATGGLPQGGDYLRTTDVCGLAAAERLRLGGISHCRGLVTPPARTHLPNTTAPPLALRHTASHTGQQEGHTEHCEH